MGFIIILYCIQLHYNYQLSVISMWYIFFVLNNSEWQYTIPCFQFNSDCNPSHLSYYPSLHHQIRLPYRVISSNVYGRTWMSRPTSYPYFCQLLSLSKSYFHNYRGYNHLLKLNLSKIRMHDVTRPHLDISSRHLTIVNCYFK